MNGFPDAPLPPPLSDEEIEAAVAGDPDAAPVMGRAEVEALVAAAARDRHGVARLRRRLGLTQAGFAGRYGVPLSTLRQWEQGVAEPDRSARILLAVIAEAPELVARVAARVPRAA